MLSTVLKTNNESLWSNVFWYVKAYVIWKFIQYSIYWDNTNAKKIPLEKINVTKNALFFISQAPALHSFTFHLQLLYELKHKVHLSKTVWGLAFSILFCFY